METFVGYSTVFLNKCRTAGWFDETVFLAHGIPHVHAETICGGFQASRSYLCNIYSLVGVTCMASIARGGSLEFANYTVLTVEFESRTLLKPSLSSGFLRLPQACFVVSKEVEVIRLPVVQT